MKYAAMLLLSVCAMTVQAADFLVTYRVAQGIDLKSLTPPQTAAMNGHGQRLMKLIKSGEVTAAGHTAGPENITGIAIIKVKDEAAAQAFVAEDPAVKAGIVKTVIQPFMALPTACEGK